jgi:hypothetical protein
MSRRAQLVNLVDPAARAADPCAINQNACVGPERVPLPGPSTPWRAEQARIYPAPSSNPFGFARLRLLPRPRPEASTAAPNR